VTDLEELATDPWPHKKRRPGRPRQKQTHCKYGHELTPDTLFWQKARGRHGQWRCRICKNEASRISKRKIRGHNPIHGNLEREQLKEELVNLVLAATGGRINISRSWATAHIELIIKALKI
jgi:hypothetical protein